MVMSTAPAEPVGEVTVNCVGLLTVNVEALTAPKLTPVAPVRLAPVPVTTVPPATGPAVGLMAVTVGTAAGVNWSAEDVGEVPLAVVTVMCWVPPEPAGEVAAIWVAEVTE